MALLGTAAPMKMPHEQSTRYHGQPDLQVTAALVQAGGGASSFDAAKLLRFLASDHADDEFRSLQGRFGQKRITTFVQTFTFAINDALKVATQSGVQLPAAPAELTSSGKALSVALVKDGTMPDGKFDVGYLIEHLLSRPIHVAIMRDINANPQIGPQRNGDFHYLLTTSIDDLKKVYAQ